MAKILITCSFIEQSSIFSLLYDGILPRDLRMVTGLQHIPIPTIGSHRRWCYSRNFQCHRYLGHWPTATAEVSVDFSAESSNRLRNNRRQLQSWNLRTHDLKLGEHYGISVKYYSHSSSTDISRITSTTTWKMLIRMFTSLHRMILLKMREKKDGHLSFPTTLSGIARLVITALPWDTEPDSKKKCH